MDKKTKIIATVGPATKDEKILTEIFSNGVNLARLNTKHNTLDWHKETVDLIIKVDEKIDRPIAIIIDLPSPDLDDEKVDLIKSLSDRINYLALSHVRNRQDVENLRSLIKGINERIGIISKIEGPEAINNIDGIIKASDGVMIARGDLAVEAGFEKLPGLQKKLIFKCRSKAKPVIVATEMLESMTKNLKPTRAEITDVANAVYEGADCLMLSGETAIGDYPVETVKMMAKIIQATEEEDLLPPLLFGKEERFPLNDETIVRLAAKMVDFIKKDDQPVGYLVFTKSGQTAFSLSSFRPKLPIFAFTDTEAVMDKMLLGYNILSFKIDFGREETAKETISRAIDILHQEGEVKSGDKLIIVSGDNIGVKGATNNIRIIMA